MITKKDLENLAVLARIELATRDEEKLLHDLENILKHFEELKEIDTNDVMPMSGGTSLSNIFRDDGEALRLSREKAVLAFPEKEKEFLKVPPVFE